MDQGALLLPPSRQQEGVLSSSKQDGLPEQLEQELAGQGSVVIPTKPKLPFSMQAPTGQ